MFSSLIRIGLLWTGILGALLIGLWLLAFVFLPQLHIARPYRIPAGSMSPAIDKGDFIYVIEIAYAREAPSRGQVIVFSTNDIPFYKNDDEQNFVKRVAGLPGETLSWHGGQLWVNGKLAPELASLHYETMGEFPGADGTTFVVPKDRYFVLGDNSHNSFDSRFWGCVPAGSLRGRALVRFWPPSRVSWIQ